MRVALAIASSSGGGGGGDGGAGVGGHDESTVRCRMGNGSGAVLARRVDGAQLECASAARGLGAARVSLSANSRAAAAAQYKRPGAAVGGTAGGVASGAAGGRRDGVRARAQYSWRWLLRRSRARKPLWRCGPGRR